MAIIKCPECGHQVSDHAKTCPSCGIDIAGNIMHCPDCGEVMLMNQEFCPNCNRPMQGAVLTSQEDSRKERPVQPVVVPPEKTEEPQAAVEEAKPKKKRSKSYAAIIVAFVLALIVVLLMFYFYQDNQKKAEIRAYENAMYSNEPAVLQNYLDMYATALPAHRDSVQARLDAIKKLDLEWQNAVSSASRTALEQFIQLHPGNVHIPEAKIKIDSLDWIAAVKADTPEAYQAYLDKHEDGAYYDEAKEKQEKLDAKKLNDEDKQFISTLFQNYFNAIAMRDETALTPTLENILKHFLHRDNATKEDVIAYMNRIHEDDITRMSYTLNNDWDIEKNEVEEGRFVYLVKFSVDQRIERTDGEKERFATYQIEAEVSPNHKISELGMKKLAR